MAGDVGKTIGPVALGNTAATVYTVPAATTFHMRCIHVCNESGSAALLTLSIGADGAGKRLYKDFSIQGNGVLNETLLAGVAAGTVIQAFSSTGANLLTLTVGGVESS
jgi:hypothetical protein